MFQLTCKIMKYKSTSKKVNKIKQQSAQKNLVKILQSLMTIDFSWYFLLQVEYQNFRIFLYSISKIKDLASSPWILLCIATTPSTDLLNSKGNRARAFHATPFADPIKIPSRFQLRSTLYKRIIFHRSYLLGLRARPFHSKRSRTDSFFSF